MPSLRKKAKAAVPFTAADVANITKNNPYIQRLIEDSDLRDNVRTALDSGKSAYERLSNGKAPHRALLEDKKLQNDLRQAAEAVRDATLSLTDAPKRKARKKRRSRPHAADRDRRRRGRLAAQREAALQGARHPVRRRGGVPVHAAGQHAGDRRRPRRSPPPSAADIRCSREGVPSGAPFVVVPVRPACGRHRPNT